MRKDIIPLIIGILLPLGLIAYVAVASYIPSLYAKPKYSFIYGESDSYYGYSTEVKNGRIVVTSPAKPSTPPGYSYSTDYPQRPPKFYLYDPKRDSVKTLSVEEAQAFTLDTSDKSPDEYKFERANNHSGFFPFYYGGYSDNYVLTGHGLNRQIPNTSYNTQFFGWITQ